MAVAACLFLYTAMVLVFGPRLLPRLTRSGLHPRLAVVAWFSAILSVPASWVAAVAFVGTDLVNPQHTDRMALSMCLDVLHSVAVGSHGVGVVVALVATGASLTLFGLRLVRALVRTRSRSHRHAAVSRMVGHQIDGVDAVLLDAPEPAAYCVAGRPHAIIVTTAALAALDRRQLAAVIAHERAHLSGRHHLLIAVTSSMASVLPRISLFRTGAEEIARLLEMAADDAAARIYGGTTVIDALLALSDHPPAPAGALAATGADVVVRAERLATTHDRRQRLRNRVSITTAVIALTTSPVIVTALALAGFAVCGVAA